jgi:hypothetical protein
MSSRKVVIDGVTYIPSRDAARKFHYPTDYVSRMARFGPIEGRRVQGEWFVSLASLQAFVADQAREKKLWRARKAEERKLQQRHPKHPI